MDSSAASIPFWLLQRLPTEHWDGPVQPLHGLGCIIPRAAITIRSVQISPQGDFVTSPSLGQDFATLLGRQLSTWLRSLADQSGRLSIVEVDQRAISRRIFDGAGGVIVTRI